MAMYVHEAPPLVLGVVRFSPLELIECGIAHPLVETYVRANPQGAEAGVLAEMIVAGATGIYFDTATILRFAANPETKHPLYTPYCEAFNDLYAFLRKMSPLSYQEFVYQTKTGRLDRALKIAAYNVNVLNALAAD